MIWLRIYTVILHAAAWFALVLFVVMLLPPVHGGFDHHGPPLPPDLILLFPLLAGFYYLNSLVFIPKVLARQKPGLYLGLLSLCAFLIMLVPTTFIIVHRPEFEHDPHPFPLVPILVSFSLFLMVLIASTGNNIVKNWFSAESQKRDIEFQKTATELSFLKSQVNPHFLFNTLNNIYTLSILKSDVAADSILKLAGMMRYVLTDMGERSVPLEQEIHYVQQFLDLQKIRLTNRVKVEFDVFGEMEKHVIAPLIFLPFIENAFKYGVSTNQDSVIKITVTLKPGSITLQTQNQVFEEKLAKELSTGTGLKNARRRLEILYPEKHWLRTEAIGNQYYADLTLTI